jgi:hypothetical protein
VTKSKARCDHPVTVQWLKMRPKGAARAPSRRLDCKCFYRGQPFRNLPRKWGAFCNIPFVMSAKKVSALAQPQIKIASAITDCLKGKLGRCLWFLCEQGKIGAKARTHRRRAIRKPCQTTIVNLPPVNDPPTLKLIAVRKSAISFGVWTRIPSLNWRHITAASVVSLAFGWGGRLHAHQAQNRRYSQVALFGCPVGSRKQQRYPCGVADLDHIPGRGRIARWHASRSLLVVALPKGPRSTGNLKAPPVRHRLFWLSSSRRKRGL